MEMGTRSYAIAKAIVYALLLSFFVTLTIEYAPSFSDNTFLQSFWSVSTGMAAASLATYLMVRALRKRD